MMYIIAIYIYLFRLSVFLSLSPINFTIATASNIIIYILPVFKKEKKKKLYDCWLNRCNQYMHD